MAVHTFHMSAEQAGRVHQVVASHCEALKNWTATAVEGGKLEYAQELVTELRHYQRLFAAFNMSAKEFIAEATDKPVRTEHIVRPIA